MRVPFYWPLPGLGEVGNFACVRCAICLEFRRRGCTAKDALQLIQVSQLVAALEAVIGSHSWGGGGGWVIQWWSFLPRRQPGFQPLPVQRPDAGAPQPVLNPSRMKSSRFLFCLVAQAPATP